VQRFRFYFGLVAGIIVTLFALQNLQPTQVHLLLWSIDLPVVAIVMAAALLGAVWSALWISIIKWRRRRAIGADSETRNEPSQSRTLE